MKKAAKNGQISTIIFWTSIALLCGIMLVFSLFNPPLFADKARNFWLNNIIQLACGFIAVVMLMLRWRIHLFGKPKSLWVLIPCLVVAIDNFQFWSYFSGNMQFVRTDLTDVMLFACYCLFTGLFEECVFRGLVFSLLASRFSQDKRGLVKTFVVSSVVFGLAHLFNLFVGANVGATLLQVGYTTLTGGLFAFALIKSKNVLIAGGVHAVYNFCGLVLESVENYGLGTGVVFDVGTTVTMAIVAVTATVFVLVSLLKYTEAERSVLYKRMGIER